MGMQPGKPLDTLAAEHVLGWKNDGGAWRDAKGKEVELKRFSVDPSAAFLLADRICEQGYRLQLDGSRLWQARFYKSVAHTLETKAFVASGGNPAQAICLAALAVLGVEPKD